MKKPNGYYSVLSIGFFYPLGNYTRRFSKNEVSFVDREKKRYYDITLFVLDLKFWTFPL